MTSRMIAALMTVSLSAVTVTNVRAQSQNELWFEGLEASSASDRTDSTC